MHLRTKRPLIFVVGGTLGVVVLLLFPDFSMDSVFRLTLLFSPLIVASLAICCDFRERPGLPWARRIPVALLLTNVLFFYSLGYWALEYVSDLGLFDRICELGALVTTAQAIVMAITKGMKWKTRTFSVASAVVLSVLWHLSKISS